MSCHFQGDPRGTQSLIRSRGGPAQLKANPGDTAAHLALGRYFCLVKGDWEAGLPHLAQGDDPDLKALAEEDLKQTPPVWKPAAGVASPAPVPAALP